MLFRLRRKSTICNMAPLIDIKIDASSLVKLKTRIEQAIDKEKLFRPVCFGLVELMTKRIHIDGLDADGKIIGKYSEAYAKRREVKYKRVDNENIVFALTSQLENGWGVVATKRGYGVGFIDTRNYELVTNILKVKYPKVFILSASEKTYAIEYINDLFKQSL